MSVKEHQDYEIEKERLDSTVEYLDKVIEASENYKSMIKGNIKQSMSELDSGDSSSMYTDVLTNTKFLETAERNFKSYKKARPKPYFARIDFKGKDEEKVRKVYIGKISLIEEKTNDMIVVDWRAPISSLYYEGRLGETSYESEGDVYEGEMSLKRQFSIQNATLEDIMDIDITATDSFLQASLQANADNRLSDIATTIQAEQNRVIRAAMNKPLIVQGVAGSGKTTIALHRIAYFVYTYEKTFDPERFLILAPNNLFINYISDVLPELGVEKVKQSTFIDFVGNLIGKSHKLTSPNTKLKALIDASGKKDTDIELMKWASAFKGSMDYREIIDAYVKDIEQSFPPVEDFIVNNQVLITSFQVRDLFLHDVSYLPLYKRVNEVKKSLNYKLKLVKEGMLQRVMASYDRRMNLAKISEYTTEQRREKMKSLIKERDERLKKLNQEFRTAVKKYLTNFPQLNLFDYYREITTNEELLMKYSKNKLGIEEVAYFTSQSRILLDEKLIELEDYAALAYLKHKLFGFEEKIEINSIVIDEAQDYSLFQFYALKAILNTDKFTLLGDLSQGIYSFRGVTSWQAVIDSVFGMEDTNYKTLKQSYRTTVEVMLLANEVIKKLKQEGIVLAEPVLRHGEKPEKKNFKDKKNLISSLEEEIISLKEEYQSIAIICKNEEECKSVKRQLDKRGMVSAKVLDEKQQEYEAGIILVPSDLAKGLEFDVVFVVNIKEQYQDTELEIKLLYVAMTRTLHRLFIYQMEGRIPLLDSVDAEFFRSNENVQ